MSVIEKFSIFPYFFIADNIWAWNGVWISVVIFLKTFPNKFLKASLDLVKWNITSKHPMMLIICKQIGNFQFKNWNNRNNNQAPKILCYKNVKDKQR